MTTKNTDTSLKADCPSATCSPSLTPETDAVWKKHSGTNAELATDAIALCGKLERERNKLREWILAAAPVMESAICIAIQENVGRISEIPGCQAIMEQCPLEWERMAHLLTENEQSEPTRRAENGR